MPAFADRIATLKTERKRHLDQATAIRDLAEDRGKELSDEDITDIEAKVAKAEELGEEIKTLEAKAERLNRLDALTKETDEVPRSRTRQAGPITEDQARTVAAHDRWLDDPNKGFKSPREFFNAVVATAGKRTELKGNLAYLATNEEGDPLHLAAGSDEQSTFSDPYGGFLVPEGMSGDMLQVLPEPDPMAGRTQMIPMDAPRVKINARVDKNHSNSVSGGLRVYRRAEADQAASSRMEMEQIALSAESLTGLAFVSDELMTDSPRSVAALLQAGFRDEFTSKLIDERLNGSGVGMYMGINTSPALITVDKESGQAADTINGTNLVKMRARCWGFANAVWIANHDTIPQLAGAHIAGTNGDQAVYFPSLQEDKPDMLLGRPIIFSEYAETLGDAGDISLANWSQYLEGIYQPLQTAESVHVRFVQHERAFRFNVRNDGQPWWRSVLTPKNSASTLSPFVRLAARA